MEPDGTLRVVDYVADPVNGFNAVVSKSAPSVHAPVKRLPIPFKPSVVPFPVVPPIYAPPLAIAQPVVKYTTALGESQLFGYLNCRWRRCR